MFVFIRIIFIYVNYLKVIHLGLDFCVNLVVECFEKEDGVR